PIGNRDVSAERGGVANHRMAANGAIVSYVNVGHQQIVVADGSEHAAAFGAAMDGARFADFVSAADFRAGTLAVILQILGRDSDGRIWVEDVVLTDFERAFKKNTRFNFGARADLDVGADDRVGTDAGGFRNLCGRVHNRGRMNGHASFRVKRGGQPARRT